MRVPVIEDDEELAETVAAGWREAPAAVDVAVDLLFAARRRLVSAQELLACMREEAADPSARPGYRI